MSPLPNFLPSKQLARKSVTPIGSEDSTEDLEVIEEEELEKYLSGIEDEIASGVLADADLIASLMIVVRRSIREHQYPAASSALEKIAKLRARGRANAPRAGHEVNSLSGMSTAQLVAALLDGLPVKTETIADLEMVLSVRFPKIDYGAK